MLLNTKPLLVSVVGPTAVGKTNMAIQLAKSLGTEIISSDSRQFYREMSIGTAVPSLDELSQAKHHFIHSHSVANEINAGDFEREALALLGQLFIKYKVIVMVGGSGLYIKALCEGLNDLPEVPPNVRELFNNRFLKYGLEPLQAELQKLDPEYAAEVDLSNHQRVIRALELCTYTGVKFSDLRKVPCSPRPFDVLTIGLNMERETLYAKINNRVEEMFELGLLEEVNGLHLYRNTYALQTVGYKEVFGYFDGLYNLNELKEKIKQNTRNFAKRQITWFNKTENITWLQPHQIDKALDIIHEKM